MSKVIQGVPESIARSDYARLIESLGLNPDRLRSLELKADGVYAEVVDLDESGHPRVVDNVRIAFNTVYIPVRDDEESGR